MLFVGGCVVENSGEHVLEPVVAWRVMAMIAEVMLAHALPLRSIVISTGSIVAMPR